MRSRAVAQAPQARYLIAHFFLRETVARAHADDGGWRCVPERNPARDRRKDLRSSRWRDSRRT